MFPRNNLGGKPWLDNRAADEMLPSVQGHFASLRTKMGLVAAAATNDTITFNLKHNVLSHIAKWERKLQINYLRWKTYLCERLIKSWIRILEIYFIPT